MNSGATTTELTAAVAEDERLRPEEKETTLRFAKGESTVSVHTKETGLMRRLLAHPEFEAAKICVVSDSGTRYIAPRDFDGGTIISVEGTLPIAVLTLATSLRATPEHADIVSEQVLRGTPEVI